MKLVKYDKSSQDIQELIERGIIQSAVITPAVARIINDVKSHKDFALFKYSRSFDGYCLSKGNIRVPKREISEAAARVDEEFMDSMKSASKNITKYHKKQFAKAKANWHTETAKGVFVGEKTTPIESVGCYVPSGRAAYPSSLLMTVIPAKVAGVKRIVVASPPRMPDTILAACSLLDVDEVYAVGGAQAVAALAYGTQSIKRVEKIVGPGNKYVTEAKRQVYGIVGIDMMAGPSEVLIIADDSADPVIVAADLLAQAEHDPDARCVFATPSKQLVSAVGRELARQAKDHPRKQILAESLPHAAAVITRDLNEAVEFANRYAAEHLQVLTKNPSKIADKIENAGAVFVGAYSPVAAGDYASGGNHVLPTGGAARFSSPLTVRDFLKTVCVQKISKQGLKGISEAVTTLAESEGLVAHAESVRKRLE